MLLQYRSDPYPLTLYIALGVTFFLHAAHLVFSALRSTADEFVKTSTDIWWANGLFTLLGAVAIYLDADFMNRGSRYDADTFYPLVQTSVLQGVACLVCLFIRRLFPSRKVMR
jgi:hypothetical protein